MSAGGTDTVVVTGLGVVSGVGTGVDAFWEGLLKGESSINRVEGFDPERFKCQIGSEVSVGGVFVGVCTLCVCCSCFSPCGSQGLVHGRV